jgi:HEAT repeat protein
MHVLLTLLEAEATPEVLASIGVALGHRADARAIGPLLPFQQHPDPDVRHAVVFGLLGQTDPRAVACLIALSADPEAHVRDWATFGLAVQIDTDTSALREALHARLHDPDGNTVGEAMVGLARRKDARVIAPLLAVLQTGDVRDIPTPELVWLGRQQLRGAVARPTDLIAAVAHFVSLGQDPIHRSPRTVILLFVE